MVAFQRAVHAQEVVAGKIEIAVEVEGIAGRAGGMRQVFRALPEHQPPQRQVRIRRGLVDVVVVLVAEAQRAVPAVLCADHRQIAGYRLLGARHQVAVVAQDVEQAARFGVLLVLVQHRGQVQAHVVEAGVGFHHLPIGGDRPGVPAVLPVERALRVQRQQRVVPGDIGVIGQHAAHGLPVAALHALAEHQAGDLRVAL
ncbi:MAG: hypothetical protein QM761_02675 [Pseudoxanthomonas sp.]